jgi:protein TonB
VVAPPIIGDIFDADIIERQSAKRYAPDDTGNITLPDFEDTSKGGVTLQVDNMRYYGYLQRLKESIQGRWIYPKSDQQKGNYGDVILEFTINKDGSLSAVRLIRTSGHRSLDEAAMDSIKNAAPFWALPDDWHAKTFTIKGHFVYVLNPYGY